MGARSKKLDGDVDQRAKAFKPVNDYIKEMGVALPACLALDMQKRISAED